MRERCDEVLGKGLYWRRGLEPTHSDVTRTFEYTVNRTVSFVLMQLVSLELKELTFAFQSLPCMTGSLYWYLRGSLRKL